VAGHELPQPAGQAALDFHDTKVQRTTSHLVIGHAEEDSRF
jgi:hypothetical protein